MAAATIMENESTFIAPEGVYTVTDEHKPFPNLSVLGGVATYPTKASTVVVRFVAQKQSGAPGLAQLLGGGSKDSRKEKSNSKEPEDGVSVSSSTETPDATDQPSSTGDHAPTSPSVAQEQRNLFSNGPTIPGGKKKKDEAHPRRNMRTANSTFITRVQTAEGLSRTLQSKVGETTFIFYNVSKTCQWVEAGSKAKDPLTRMTFSVHPTCHDINLTTASPDHLEVIIGFSSGDLLWMDLITTRYERLNKQGCITNSPCTAVRWVPSSTNLFLVSHADGSIVVYDKARDDGSAFTPQDPVGRSLDNGSSSSEGSRKDWDPMDNIFVSMPPWHPAMSVGTAQANGKNEKDKVPKNPVSHWRVAKKSIVDFVFSPDVKYVAAISEDGCLRVVDALAEQLVDCYSSYFGALTCVAWSHDGRFILTGGQDDLLTIFSPWEQRVVARCQGHSSFVSSIAFDDLRCDGRTYRFGSVGEDNKLILWDFSSGVLHRPKHQAHHRNSMSSTISLALRRDRSSSVLPAANLSSGPDGRSLRFHPAPPRNEVAVVQPVLVKSMEGDILTTVSFLQRSLLTATKTGHVKLWIRPLALKPRKNARDIDPLT